MKRVYLDHSATTPVRREVAEQVVQFMIMKYGNPSSVHSFGREAKMALDQAREQVAWAINAAPQSIVFTSGGTEADNLAVTGVAQAYQDKGRHIITSSIEHHAVLDSCQRLEKEGFQVTYLPVDNKGFVSLEDVKNAINDGTILISIMHANNEMGTIQPIEEIGSLARERGIIFHSDCVQSLGKIPVDVEALKVDIISGSGHKIYAPKGTGFIYIRPGTRIKPLVYGGGQERNYRPGTENLPGIVGLGLALELAVKDIPKETPRISKLRDMLIEGLQKQITDIKLNGDLTNRVPNNVNISIQGVEGESLLLALDMKGIGASSGSACSAGSINPSHVLLAMGLPPEHAQTSIRMTLGRDNTPEDIEYVLDTLPSIVEKLRNMPSLKIKD